MTKRKWFLLFLIVLVGLSLLVFGIQFRKSRTAKPLSDSKEVPYSPTAAGRDDQLRPGFSSQQQFHQYLTFDKSELNPQKLADALTGRIVVRYPAGNQNPNQAYIFSVGEAVFLDADQRDLGPNQARLQVFGRLLYMANVSGNAIESLTSSCQVSMRIEPRRYPLFHPLNDDLNVRLNSVFVRDQDQFIGILSQDKTHAAEQLLASAEIEKQIRECAEQIRFEQPAELPSLCMDPVYTSVDNVAVYADFFSTQGAPSFIPKGRVLCSRVKREDKESVFTPGGARAFWVKSENLMRVQGDEAPPISRNGSKKIFVGACTANSQTALLGYLENGAWTAMASVAEENQESLFKQAFDLNWFDSEGRAMELLYGPVGAHEKVWMLGSCPSAGEVFVTSPVKVENSKGDRWYRLKDTPVDWRLSVNSQATGEFNARLEWIEKGKTRKDELRLRVPLLGHVPVQESPVPDPAFVALPKRVKFSANIQGDWSFLDCWQSSIQNQNDIARRQCEKHPLELEAQDGVFIPKATTEKLGLDFLICGAPHFFSGKPNSLTAMPKLDYVPNPNRQIEIYKFKLCLPIPMKPNESVEFQDCGLYFLEFNTMNEGTALYFVHGAYRQRLTLTREKSLPSLNVGARAIPLAGDFDDDGWPDFMIDESAQLPEEGGRLLLFLSSRRNHLQFVGARGSNFCPSHEEICSKLDRTRCDSGAPEDVGTSDCEPDFRKDFLANLTTTIRERAENSKSPSELTKKFTLVSAEKPKGGYTILTFQDCPGENDEEFQVACARAEPTLYFLGQRQPVVCSHYRADKKRLVIEGEWLGVKYISTHPFRSQNWSEKDVDLESVKSTAILAALKERAKKLNTTLPNLLRVFTDDLQKGFAAYLIPMISESAQGPDGFYIMAFQDEKLKWEYSAKGAIALIADLNSDGNPEVKTTSADQSQDLIVSLPTGKVLRRASSDHCEQAN